MTGQVVVYNKERLGLTEYETVNRLYDTLKELVDMEKNEEQDADNLAVLESASWQSVSAPKIIPEKIVIRRDADHKLVRVVNTSELRIAIRVRTSRKRHFKVQYISFPDDYRNPVYCR